jgi:hypothetical protein
MELGADLVTNIEDESTNVLDLPIATKISYVFV